MPPASERVEEFRGAFLSFQCARFISSKSLSPGVEQEPTEKTEKRSVVLRFLLFLLFRFSASEEICPAPSTNSNTGVPGETLFSLLHWREQHRVRLRAGARDAGDDSQVIDVHRLFEKEV